MLKKKKEIENYTYDKYFNLNNNEYIEEYVKNKFKNAKFLDTTFSGTSGSKKFSLDSSGYIKDVIIEKNERGSSGTVIYYKGGRVWDNRVLSGYKGKSKFSKIVS